MLELKNIYKTYSSKNGVTHRALENVSLKFESKGLCFILGKSGSGKSTLLNLIGGLDDFDRGDIFFNGKSFNSFDESDYNFYRNSCIGFVFQEFNLLDNLSVFENVEIALDLQSKKDDNHINELLKSLNLYDIRNRKVIDLTGGQKQKVSIARALIKNPRIILADEPTGSLDSENSDEIIHILKDLSKDRLVIIVTHNKDLAYEFSDRIIEIKDGFVLKDLQRKEIDSEKITNPTLVSANLLIVPENKEIKEENINDINATILEKRQDYYILIEQDKRRVMSLYPNVKEVIDDDNKDVFKPYIYDENDKVEETVKHKSNLSMIKGAKLGFASLRQKKIKLFFTILLSILAVILTGTASNFTNYILSDAVASSIEKDNCSYLEVSSSFSVNDSEYKLQNNDIEYLNNLDNKLSYAYNKNLAYSYLAVNTKVDKLMAADKLFLNEQFTGFLVTDNISDYGYLGNNFKLIYQKENLKAEDYDNGVIISSIIAETIYKYSQYEDTYNKKLNDVTEILNEDIYKLRIDGKGYPVIGIYDIENEAIYNHFKPLHENEYSASLYREYQSVADTLFKKLVVTNNFFTKYKSNITSLAIKGETTNINNIVQYSDYLRPVSNIDTSLTTTSIQFIDSSWNANNYKEKINSMGENEIFIGKELYDNLVGKIYKAADAPSYINTFNNGNHYLNIEKIGTTLSQKEVYQTIDNIKVIGIVTAVRGDSRLSGFYVKNNLFYRTIDAYYQPNRALIVLNKGEKQQALVQSLYDNGFTISNDFVSYFLTFVSTIKQYSSLINIAAIVWFVIVAILLYSFMSGSIKDGSYQIGVLKALGANIKDIYKIYAVEAFIIGIFATVFGILGYYFGGLLINKVITDNFYTFYFPIFIFKPISILQMTLTTFIVLSVAVIIPMSRIKNIKPIDVMNMVN